MNYFEALLNKFKNVKPSQIFEGVLRGNEELFIDLVRKEQIKDKGVDGQGEIIGFYSPFSKKVQNLSFTERLAGVPYDLYDTGTFYNSFELKETNGSIYIMADGLTGKREDIINKYGNAIFYHQLKETHQHAIQCLFSNFGVFVRKYCN